METAIKVRIAGLLVERGVMPPVIMCAGAVAAERSRTLLYEAYREHARRLARAIDQRSDHDATSARQGVTPIA